MSTVFTMPGKMGDALMQWPVAHQWIKQNGKTCELWIDRKTCAPLKALFEAQPGVDKVELRDGVESYNCGGQPFHMNIDLADTEGHLIYHLGMRAFPQRQITLQTLQDARASVIVPSGGWTPTLDAGGQQKRNRLVLHGQAICGSTSGTPTFWKFLAGIRKELKDLFEEIVFVGSPDDLEVAKSVYPEWGTFDDGGDLLKTAKLMQESKACIGTGSSMVVLAWSVGLPTIRVHDAIGEFPKTIWSLLGDEHLNETEVTLRKEWPIWRDKYLVESEVTKS